MSSKSFSIGEVFRFAWNAFKENALVFVLLTLLWGVVQVLFAIPACGHELIPPPEQTPEKAGGAFCLILNALHYLVNAFFMLGFATVGLVAAEGKKVTFEQFVSKAHKFTSFIVANIIYNLIFFFGLLLFIVPGIYWALKYCLYPYAVVDKGAFGWDALKFSGQATDGAKWELLGFYLVVFLLLIAGGLIFGLGLFIVIPLIWIAQAYIWKQLTKPGA